MSSPKIGRTLQDSGPDPKEAMLRSVEGAGAAGLVSYQTPPREISPAEAGETLLAYLPADAQKLVREAAGLQDREIWHVLLGYALRAYEVFDMFMYSHLDSWERKVKPTEAWPCDTCGSLMWSRFPESKYCCASCYFGKLPEKGHHDDCLIQREPRGTETV